MGQKSQKTAVSRGEHGAAATVRASSKRRNADKIAEREAELLLAKIHAGLDEAHAQADRMLARLK